MIADRGWKGGGAWWWSPGSSANSLSSSFSFFRAGAFMALASDNGEESEMMKNASPEDAEE